MDFDVEHAAVLLHVRLGGAGDERHLPGLVHDLQPAVAFGHEHAAIRKERQPPWGGQSIDDQLLLEGELRRLHDRAVR